MTLTLTDLILDLMSSGTLGLRESISLAQAMQAALWGVFRCVLEDS